MHAALLAVFFAASARAQVDPKPRQLLQFGWDQPLSGGQPIGYGFYYLNRPDFYRRDMTLRLVVAPVYVDSELGLVHFAPHTDLGIGLAGGGFAYGHTEIRHGGAHEAESFQGNGFSLALSLYHRLNPGKRIPLSLVLRGTAAFASFAASSKTDPAFQVPTDHQVTSARAGLRWGGEEPEVGKSAMELSIWYEGKFRTSDQEFGFGDRGLRHESHFGWARALLAYNFPSGRYARASLTAGTSGDADRLNAWRLGGSLPFVSEFPLNLPGYAYQELTARSFALLDSRVLFPVDRDKRIGLGLWGAISSIDYLPGFEQAGSLNSGAGLWGQYSSPAHRWRVAAQYGYGFQAIRAPGRGAHSIGLTAQFRIGKPTWPLPFEPGAPSERPRGGYYTPLRR